LKNIILTLSVLFIFTGCSTKIALEEYKDISSLNIIKHEKIKYKKPSISTQTIFINSYNKNYNKYFNITKSLILEKLLSKNYFEVKDSKSNYKVYINIDSLDTIRRYHKSRYIETKKGGYYTEAYWTYNTSAILSAKMIYSNDRYSYFTASESVHMSEYSKINVPSSTYIKAIDRSLSQLVKKIAQSITPVATIISKKVHIEDTEDQIFLINMGIDYGVYKEQRVKIYKDTIEKNEVTSSTMLSRVFIADGRVSNQVLKNESWIVLDNEDKNNLIEIGDKVELIYTHY